MISPLLSKLEDYPVWVVFGGGLAGKHLPEMRSHYREFP